MAKFLSALLLAIPLLGAAPDVQAPAGFERWTSASFAQVRSKMDLAADKSPNHFASERLSDYPNDAVLLVTRKADGPPEWHRTQLDVMLVQSGSATLLVGGTLVNAEALPPDDQRGGTIEGGTRLKISAGDIIRIPARTPHQLFLDGSKELDYLVVKVKGY
jgi:mannose-6-phosphate isomerase-like protein (cupin superfamily)